MPPQVNAEPVSPATLPPVKPGLGSTEFKIASAILVACFIALMSGKLPAVWFAFVSAVTGVVYFYVRTTLKTAHLEFYAQLLQTAFEKAPFNVPAVNAAQTPGAESPSTAQPPVAPETLSFTGPQA